MVKLPKVPRTNKDLVPSGDIIMFSADIQGFIFLSSQRPQFASFYMLPLLYEDPKKLLASIASIHKYRIPAFVVPVQVLIKNAHHGILIQLMKNDRT